MGLGVPMCTACRTAAARRYFLLPPEHRPAGWLARVRSVYHRTTTDWKDFRQSTEVKKWVTILRRESRTIRVAATLPAS